MEKKKKLEIGLKNHFQAVRVASARGFRLMRWATPAARNEPRGDQLCIFQPGIAEREAKHRVVATVERLQESFCPFNPANHLVLTRPSRCNLRSRPLAAGCCSLHFFFSFFWGFSERLSSQSLPALTGS